MNLRCWRQQRPQKLGRFNFVCFLQEENIAFTKGSLGDLITAKDVLNLKYTNKVVDEVIRMANVAAFVFRKVANEVDYKGT